MQHTYLRYECADAFSLTTSSSTTSNPTTSPLGFLSTTTNNTNSDTTSSPPPTLLSTSGSQIIGFNLRTSEPCLKLGHRELLSGGIGTGRGLNGDEVLCLVVDDSSSSSSGGGGEGDGGEVSHKRHKVASGWKDGSVRVFDVFEEDLSRNTSSSGSSGRGLVHSFLTDLSSREEEFLTREPLVLNGHSGSPVTCLTFDGGGGVVGGIMKVSNRLVSGSSDGTVVLWDILAETGLFRLLGHHSPVTDLSFLPSSSSSLDGGGRGETLISSSHDGLVKVWDLDGQCCAQTIVNHGGQVTCSTTVLLPGKRRRRGGSGDGDGSSDGGLRRERLVTGCSDGRIRLYSIGTSHRILPSHSKDLSTTITPTPDNETSITTTNNKTTTPPPSTTITKKEQHDDICHYMGELPLPANVAASNEKITSLHFSPTGKYLGISRNNSREIAVYFVRSEADALRKRTRRLRRRREKERKEARAVVKSSSSSNNDYNDGLGSKKGKKRGILDDDEDEEEEKAGEEPSLIPLLSESQDPEELKASDEFQYLSTIKCSHRVKAFTFSPSRDKNGRVKVVAALSSNTIEVHSIGIKHNNKSKEDTTTQNDDLEFNTELTSSLDMYGHPTGIRSIALSDDDVLACTVSKDVTKVWNIANRSCIRSLRIGQQHTTTNNSNKKEGPSSFYGLCSTFLPGNTHIVVGTREGYLLIVDIASGDIVFTEQAHEGAVWSIDLKSPSKEEDIAIITGSADNSVKFWDVARQDDDDDDDIDDNQDDNDTAGHPMLIHARTLQTKDDVVTVRYSHSKIPSKRMVFVSTLDCQINVFFDDTLKFFLSLYGHSLPALALDASDDDAILASGSADKSIKIWGLDFGDTHRTMYGHGDSITDLKFVKNTHNFFTTSKDRTVRYWDGDRFEQILLLEGHTAEINSLAIGRGGAYVLSAGMDRQVRVWERTKDMVFLEEEKERAMETVFEEVDNKGDEEGTAQLMRRRRGQEDIDGDDGAAEDDGPQSEAAVKKSVLSVAAGDRIMEAIERSDQEMKEAANFRRSQDHENGADKKKKRMPNPMLLGMDPPDYILWILRSVKSSELEMSLLILPLAHMERLIYYMIVLLRNGKGVEICARSAIFLIKTHHHQVAASKSMATPLRELRRLLKTRLVEARDTVGYNLAAMRIITKTAKDHKNRYYIPDPADEVKDVWAGLGLGSEAAADIQKRGNR